MKTILLCVLLYAYTTCNSQSLPFKPNMIDSNGLKHGEWIYYYDNDWNTLNDSINVSFYRLTNYKDSKPIGKVTDYYSDGGIQMQADSMIQENPDTYHGNLFFYSKLGRIHSVEFYNNGVMDTIKTIQIFESLIEKYQKEIPTDLDLAQTANDLAYLYRVQGNYGLAEKYYEIAKNIRENRLGKSNLLYAHSCAKLGWVYLKQSRHLDAESLFLNSLRIYENQLGKSSDRYRDVRDHLITIYKETNQDIKLKDLQY